MFQFIFLSKELQPVKFEIKKFNEWKKNPRLNFIEYLNHKSIFVISTFLEFGNVLRLMQTCQSCYCLFSTDLFWKHIYRTYRYLPRDCPFVSFEFINKNYGKLKEIKNNYYLNEKNYATEKNTNLSTANIGRNFNSKNNINTQYIRKFALKYEKVKTASFLINNLLGSMRMRRFKNDKLQHLSFNISLRRQDQDNTESKILFDFIKLEYMNNFIKLYRGCHIVAPYDCHDDYHIPEEYDEIYVFNYLEEDKNKIDLFCIFLANTNNLRIYDDRKDAINNSMKLTANMLNLYGPDDVTMEATDCEETYRLRKD